MGLIIALLGTCNGSWVRYVRFLDPYCRTVTLDINVLGVEGDLTRMDAFKLLKRDHDEVKKMFKNYEDAGDSAYKTKHQIAEQIFQELDVHETIEEEIFYPAVRENASKEGVEIVLESYEEHHVADLLIEELQSMDIEDERYDAKFKVLQENIEHHIQEEEAEMFPEAKKALGDTAEDIGERMEARKNELLQRAGAR
jgi:iron-sulfur cluster repair protein YtfE (RIC family)